MSEYKYYIKNIYQPAADQVVIEAGDKKGRPVFSYRPGQYAMISYRNSKGQLEDKHAFSIASAPNRTDVISFGIKIQGPFTRGLLNLKAGDELNIFGPYGKFYFNENKHSDLVMIAGGIGITPFFSALTYAADLKLANKLSLIYSVKNKDGATFYEEIKNLKQNNSNMSALFSFTEEKGISEDRNVLYKRLDAKIIKDFVGDTDNKTFFICGPALFMASMVANLLSLGVARNQIEMEEFSMMPDKDFFPRLRNISYALAFSIIIFIISFSLIHKTTSAAVKKNYDPILANKINQAAYNQMIATYAAKNKAITGLNQQILSATQNSNNRTGTTVSQKTNKTVTPSVSRPVMTVAPTPMYTPPTPVYIMPPAPVTSASRVR